MSQTNGREMQCIVGKPFLPGQCGNPNGRPKRQSEIVSLARTHTEAAIVTLAGIMNDERAKVKDRIKAIGMILDRAYGKPATITIVEHHATSQREVIIRHEAVPPLDCCPHCHASLTDVWQQHEKQHG